MKNKISIKYANGLVLTPTDVVIENFEATNDALAATVIAEMMRYGFTVSEELHKTLRVLSETSLTEVYNSVVPVLREMKGADVDYTPMYPNFPQQVMEASELELFINAICHYWTFGEWKPEYLKLPREVSLEKGKFREIGLITEEDFSEIFVQLLKSKDSISDADKKTVAWFIDYLPALPNVEIPFKENLCTVAGILFEKDKDISNLIKTATDVLRIATHLSGGDISLAENTKFKSLPRKQRRVLVAALERVATEEDINRHRGKWVKLFHSLHVGEFSSNLWLMAKKVRNNQKIETFNGKVQEAIDDKRIYAAVNLLMDRPGEFARKIDHLLRLTLPELSDDRAFIISSFLSKVHRVPTRILLQLLGNLKVRDVDSDKRIVFPKGNTQRAFVVRTETLRLTDESISTLRDGITASLKTRFAKLQTLGKVWIDPVLTDCPLPTQQRSASEGLFQVGRGTRLPIGDNNTLRFFIYWVGQDIDLSATLHDENFKKIEHISYTNLRSAKYEACHSGDIVDGRHGACEFIDITIDKAAEFGARYVAMNVLVYAGPTFAEHDKVYAGWMTRENQQSNEIFEPTTVEQKIDLRSNSKNVIPVIFDLVERRAIWTDLTTPGNYSYGFGGYYGGNNVENNRASIEETLEAITNIKNKVTLFELFKMHASARGELVGSKEEADTVFSVYEGITPYNITLINSEYLV